MYFHIHHTTEYQYRQPASESFSELRLRPRDSSRQRVWRFSSQVQPPVPVESYTDYFGNLVETISIPFRHDQLSVTSTCEVVTHPLADPLSGLDLTVSEARLLMRTERRLLHDFLRPSPFVPFSKSLQALSAELLPGTRPFPEAIKHLNHYLFANFKYQPGSTDVTTSVPEFLAAREGVCQDFAHLMICLLRQAGLPARYVSGYIESSHASPGGGGSEEDAALIGNAASHAWVEVYCPNGKWAALDPTNNIPEGERHVQIATGRDYHDVTPLKGIFKGANSQSLSVRVSVKRVKSTEPAEAP